MDFSSPVWLGAIVRQTDPSSYTYISLHTTFRVVLWFVDDGPPTAFYRSPMLLSFPVSSPGASAGKPSNWMARVVSSILRRVRTRQRRHPSIAVFESPSHQNIALFFLLLVVEIRHRCGVSLGWSKEFSSGAKPGKQHQNSPIRL